MPGPCQAPVAALGLLTGHSRQGILSEGGQINTDASAYGMYTGGLSSSVAPVGKFSFLGIAVFKTALQPVEAQFITIYVVSIWQYCTMKWFFFKTAFVQFE